VAEWTAVVRGLELARELGAAEVELLLDSKLIVEQLAGRWRVRDPKLGPLYAEAHRQLGALARWSADHVPRALNAIADELANQAIDRVAAGGPVRVVLRPGDPRPDPIPRRTQSTPASPIHAWMDGYVRAWRSNDPADIRPLFADDATYQMSPFASQVRGRDAIIADWQERSDEPDTWNFDYEVVCADATLGVVTTTIDYFVEKKEYRTVWVIRFDAAGRATAFTEWWMERSTSS
jgi:hypothetical protein